ncbi:MAG: extracellular solute-binding protein [Gammaproteobacteria bacterium]|nr:extracellular solute-binding protein [Gammaproteobacteria bacterium]
MLRTTHILVAGLLLILAQTIQAADSIVVYSGRSDKFVKPVINEFSKQTGIDVILHTGSSTALLNKLNVEAARTDADLFLSNDAGTLQKGSDLGLFMEIPSAITDQIGANYRAKDNSWIGLSARARVLVINTNNPLAKNLSSVFDLADPKLKGHVGITNSTNESYIAGATVYMLSAGKEKTKTWLQGLKDNVGGKVFNKHGMIVKSVASGKLAAGLVNHYYIYRHLDEYPNDPIAIVLPDQGKDGIGVAWNVAGIAITKHSKKRELAEKLITYLVSNEGQKMFAEANHEYPTRTGVPASAKVPAAGSFKVADVPMYKLGTQRDETIDLIETVGMP